MVDKHSFFPTRRFAWLLALLLIAAGVYCFFKPLVLSIDSVYGFLAYKGTMAFHTFNVVQDVSAADIGRVNPVFESWWSPGQWLFPAFLNYVFAIRLGTASLLVTWAAAVAGFAGYYRVFSFYRFSQVIVMLSLLVIFSSATLYYSFVIYQGGEILEFATFPWFLFYVIKIRQVTWRNLTGVGFLFLLCFLAKITLLLYCTLVLLAKCLLLNDRVSGKQFRISTRHFALLLPALICIPSICVFFLARGPRPTVMRYFGLSPEAVLVPLSSPLSSILSVQQYIKRAEVIFSGFFTGSFSGIVFSSFLYLSVVAVLIWFLLRISQTDKINAGYKIVFFILYAGLFVFFSFAYLFHTNIDLSARHFKLMGYLLVPGLLAVLQGRARASGISFLALLFCLMAVLDIYYLKEKWSADRYIGINYFYRNSGPLGTRDRLDQWSYQKLVDFDRESRADRVIFYVESTADVAIDLRHPVILPAVDDNGRAKIYRGNSPDLFVCVSKFTLLHEEGFLQRKFPDYGHFNLIAETDHYRYFFCEGNGGSHTRLLK